MSESQWGTFVKHFGFEVAGRCKVVSTNRFCCNIYCHFSIENINLQLASLLGILYKM